MSDRQDRDLLMINEAFAADRVTPAQLDLVLADGWRHFGTHFFRYSLNLYRGEIVRVTPLRIRLSEFRISKSQQRILKRNADLSIEVAPAEITPEVHDLFDRHKCRFDHAVPDSIYDFLSPEPATVPTECCQITVRGGKGQLLAVSYFDVAADSTSAIYGCFEPGEGRRSLGIFTMLKVIEHSASSGKTFYYHGYAYDSESFYDYKKQFVGLEEFDWEGHWRAVNRVKLSKLGDINELRSTSDASSIMSDERSVTVPERPQVDT